MLDTSAPVLLDNCAISACTGVGAWKALVSRYNLETVVEVASEAATGSTNRTKIDPRDFERDVKVHDVSEDDRLACEAEYAELAGLDDGEKDLWVHALGRTDGWILCGPDLASIRFGVRAGHAHRLISLEALLLQIGHTPKVKLRPNQTAKWLRDKVGQFTLELQFQKKSMVA